MYVYRHGQGLKSTCCVVYLSLAFIGLQKLYVFLQIIGRERVENPTFISIANIFDDQNATCIDPFEGVVRQISSDFI